MSHKNRIAGIVAGVVCLVTAVSSNAEEWKILGPRALGMGGAHVAVVNDSTAQYWNPAVFGFFGRQASERVNKDEHSDKDFGIYIQGGAGFQAHQNVIKEIEDLSAGGLNFSQLSLDVNSGTGLSDISNVDDFIKMIAELEDLNKENIAVSAIAGGSFNVRVRSFGLGIISSADVVAIPIMDVININPSSTATTNTELISELGNLQTATGANSTFEALTDAQQGQLNATMSNWTPAERDGFLYALDDALALGPDGIDGTDDDFNATTNPVPQEDIDNAATVSTLANNALTGGSFDDNTSKVIFRGALVTEVPLSYGYALSDNLSIGGNLKYLKARVYSSEVLVFDSNTDDFFADATDSYVESSNFAVDLAAMYKFDSVRFGIVGRNLNTPAFDQTAPGDYKLDPQLRAGAAFRAWNMITFAADLDITENSTLISTNYQSQNVAGGMEIDLWKFLKLRGGIYKNLSENDIGVVYTAGLGLNLYFLQIDLAGAMSADKARVDGKDVPEEARALLAISSQF